MFSPQDGVLLSLSSSQHPGKQRRGAGELSRQKQWSLPEPRGVGEDRQESDFEVLEPKRSAYLWKMFLGLGKRQEGKKHIFCVPTVYQDFICINSATLEGGYYYSSTIFLLVTIIVVPSFYWMKKLW